MPNTPAQIKTVRQVAKRRALNRSHKTALYTQLRKLADAITAGDKGKAQEELQRTLVALGKSASRGQLHANKAARKKSRLCAQVAKMGQAPQSAPAAS